MIESWLVFLPIIGWVLGLLLLYVVIQSAVLVALRRARGEAWIEQHLPEKAKWLSVAQRTVLAEHKAQRDAEGGSGN